MSIIKEAIDKSHESEIEKSGDRLLYLVEVGLRV